MKSPYHRTGKNAKFVSIDRWWFCDTCNNMFIGPEIPSEEAGDYSDPGAAKIYPVVSPFVKNAIDKSGYLYVNELKERNEVQKANNVKIKDEITKLINPRKQEEQQDLTPHWYCTNCDQSELIPPDFPEEKVEGKIHECGQQLQITILPNHTGNEDKLAELHSILQKNIEDEKSELAGKVLLEITLEEMSQPFGLLYSPDFVTYRSMVRTNREILEGTWGCQTIKCLVAAFSDDNEEEESLDYLKTNVTNFTLELVSDVFSDITLYLSHHEAEQIPKYRAYFTKVKKNIKESMAKMTKFQDLTEQLNSH